MIFSGHILALQICKEENFAKTLSSVVNVVNIFWRKSIVYHKFHWLRQIAIFGTDSIRDQKGAVANTK